MMHLMVDFSLQGLRPIIPEQTPYKLSSLIEQCWQTEPSVRPDFCHISIALQQLVAEVGAFQRISYAHMLVVVFGSYLLNISIHLRLGECWRSRAKAEREANEIGSN
jgi:hypothetical protein